METAPSCSILTHPINCDISIFISLLALPLNLFSRTVPILIMWSSSPSPVFPSETLIEVLVEVLAEVLVRMMENLQGEVGPFWSNLPLKEGY